MSIFSANVLDQKHILVTGATGGIGKETAKVLATMGASLTITGRNREKLEQARLEILEHTDGANLLVKAADITNKEERENLVQCSLEQFGSFYGLVNSAGIAGLAIVEDLEEDEIERMMDLNFKSTFSLTKLVYRHMIEKKQGNIVNVASLSGLRGVYGNSAYTASKFALIGWTQCMAVEAIQHQIRVNAVCPGFVETVWPNPSYRHSGPKKPVIL